VAHSPGHLAANPLPPGILGSLGLSGYQLLGEVAGVGAGRLGPQAFLLVAPDPDPALPDAGTQLSLHHQRVRAESEVVAFTQLAAQLGYMRLSGYRLALERAGLRSKIGVVNPATGAVVATIPEKHPGGGLFGSRSPGAAGLLASLRALPSAGSPPDPQNSELMHQVLLALALRDETLGGAEAAELADRALELAQADRALDPPAALEAARRGS
jgi:hypothetical protein